MFPPLSVYLYLLAIPILWGIILYFYFHKDKNKEVKVTHPIIIYWRGMIGILVIVGIIYSILHSMNMI
jgi:hypothetical protein